MRKIHINGVEWDYKVGRCNVLIVSPTQGQAFRLAKKNEKRVKHAIHFVDFFNIPNESWENIHENGGSIAVTPSAVKCYIEKHFINPAPEPTLHELEAAFRTMPWYKCPHCGKEGGH